MTKINFCHLLKKTEQTKKTTNSFSVRFRIFAVNNKSGSVMIIYNV